MENPGKVSNKKCLIVEFLNEKNKNGDAPIEVGFLEWLKTNDQANLKNIIKNKTVVKIFWPVNIKVAEAANLNRNLEKIQWNEYSAVVLETGGKTFSY